jgi:hypothetical protein
MVSVLYNDFTPDDSHFKSLFQTIASGGIISESLSLGLMFQESRCPSLSIGVCKSHLRSLNVAITNSGVVDLERLLGVWGNDSALEVLKIEAYDSKSFSAVSMGDPAPPPLHHTSH